MATSASRKGVRILRFGLSGAIASALIFVGLWIAAQFPMGPSEMIVELFTTRGPNSTAGLQEGVLYAALIGFFAGAIGDLAYEALQWFEQR
ncbi:MAG TPA: hypothetical protein VK192_05485 [Sphingomicrobium sp.]|jgi:hypothetical protein|nr:hypothetical protein [Sphingomicrobium sp.]